MRKPLPLECWSLKRLHPGGPTPRGLSSLQGIDPSLSQGHSMLGKAGTFGDTLDAGLSKATVTFLSAVVLVPPSPGRHGTLRTQGLCEFQGELGRPGRQGTRGGGVRSEALPWAWPLGLFQARWQWGWLENQSPQGSPLGFWWVEVLWGAQVSGLRGRPVAGTSEGSAVLWGGGSLGPLVQPPGPPGTSRTTKGAAFAAGPFWCAQRLQPAQLCTLGLARCCSLKGLAEHFYWAPAAATHPIPKLTSRAACGEQDEASGRSLRQHWPQASSREKGGFPHPAPWPQGPGWGGR